MIKKLLFALMVFGAISLVSCSPEKEPQKPGTEEPDGEKPKDPDPEKPDPEKPEVPTLPKSLAKQWKMVWSEQYSKSNEAWQPKKYISTDELITLKMDSTVVCQIADYQDKYKRWTASGDTLYLIADGGVEVGFKYEVVDNMLTVASFDKMSRIRFRDHATPQALDPQLFGSWLLDSMNVYDVKGGVMDEMKVDFRQTMNIKSNGEYLTPRIWGLGPDSLVYKWSSDSKVFYLSIPEEPAKIYDYDVIVRDGKRVLYQLEYLFDENSVYLGYQLFVYNEYVLPAVVGRWDLLHIQPFKKGKPVGDPETPNVLYRQFFDVEGGNVVTDLSTDEQFFGFWSIKGDKLILIPEGADGTPDVAYAAQLRYKVEADKLYMFAPVPPGEAYDEVANVYVRVK